MPVARHLWKQTLTNTHAPMWPCPTCSSGKLRLKRDALHYEKTAESRLSSYDEYPNVMGTVFTFSTLLECSDCNEIISCCGLGGYYPRDVFDEDGSHSQDYEVYFAPKYFSMPMRIFQPPARCPDTGKEQLRSSFAVFFCDLSAAANRVRQCIEEILSDAGVESQNSDGEFVSLGNRINSYRDLSPDNADRVNALRWIGNFGSHPETLTKDDLFDAYDILEVLLEDLYVGHQSSVRQLVERINESRGPRSRTL